MTGEPPGDTLPRLAVVGFNSDDTLDFTTLPSSSPANLVVRFGFFNENFQQIRRRINYGPDVNNCTSDMVTVTRLTEGCWEVESKAVEEACLSKGTGRGKNASTELQGTYNMPFLMTLRTFTGFDSVGNPTDLASCSN